MTPILTLHNPAVARRYYEAGYWQAETLYHLLMRNAAQPLASMRICVNALAPGFFASEMTDGYQAGYLESQLPRVLAGRTGDPDELAAALVFLVSDAGGYVTGTTLVVDGGHDYLR